MAFQVRDPAGQVFGPVEVETLQEWVRGGRMTQDMTLLDEAGAEVGPAGNLADLADLWPPEGQTYCPNCHALVIQTARVCPNCGWTAPLSSLSRMPRRGTSPLMTAFLIFLGLVALLIIVGLFFAGMAILGIIQTCFKQH